MGEDNNTSDRFLALRRQAEKKHADRLKNLKEKRALSPEEKDLLVHELEVHQIELEIQNEELRRIQHELEAEKNRYFDLYDFSPVGYVTASEKGTIIRANLTICKMLGVERERLKGRPFSSFIPKAFKDSFYLLLRRLFETKAHQSATLKIKDSTGSEHHVQMDCVIEEKDNGDLKQVRMAITDISAQKQVEKALKESENRARALLEAMPDLMFRMNRQGVFLDYKAKASDLYAQSEDTIIGKNNRDISPPDFADLVEEKIRHTLYSGRMQTFEYQLPIPGRGSVDFEARMVKSDEDEITAIVRDITEKKAMENQLHQAGKMATIGTLAGGIAHDFNNLLSIIIGNAELAIEDFPQHAQEQDNLKEIIAAGIRGAGIVKQLLNYTRKTSPELKPIAAATVIEESLKFLRATIPTTIEIRKSLPADNVTILADPVQIEQVLMNICTNAAQEMEKTGGIIQVSAEKTVWDQASSSVFPDLAEGDYLKITVGDTGPGIDPVVIDRIFDPYFTTKDLAKNTGMGLSVVHTIVKNHNGAITVDSKPGKGAVFTILFPVVHGQALTRIKPADKIRGGHETILFVDDEESLAKLMGFTLGNLGYTVETRMSPMEALALFQSKPDHFDLVITDMTMPQMNGVQLAEKLMDIRKDIPVIICTGHSALIDEDKAEALGIAGFIMKPLQKRDIAAAIRNVFDSKKQ